MELQLPLLTLICCLFILHLSYVVMSRSLFPIFISLVSHHCLPSALLVHLLLCLTAHLLSGKHFSACFDGKKTPKTSFLVGVAFIVSISHFMLLTPKVD